MIVVGIKNISSFIIIYAFFSIFSIAYAECRCECVNGKEQPICDSSMDLKPFCGVRICPIPPPHIDRPNNTVLPPLGFKQCVDKQVYNRNIGGYELRTVCQ